MSSQLLILLFGLVVGMFGMGLSLYLRLANVNAYYEQDMLSFIAPFYLVVSLYCLIFRAMPNSKMTPIRVWFMLGLAFVAGVVNYYLMVFTNIPARILSPYLNFKS